MRWSRVVKLSMAMATLAAVLVGAIPAWHWLEAQRQERAQRPDPVVASPDETRDILSAAITALELKGLPPPPGLGDFPDSNRNKVLLIADQSVCFDSTSESDCSHRGETLLYPELEGVAPLKLRRELVFANNASVFLLVAGIPGTEVAESEEIRLIFESGEWDDFYKRFPDTAGFVRISQPVLSKDREKGLLYVSHHCGGLCGSGTVLLLVRNGASWSVEKHEQIWIS